VPPEVTALTGIRFASIDWQPCGHKDIVICHAESHYDIHFYYVEESDLAAQPVCDIGSPSNPNLPICMDSATNQANRDYFKLINGTIPVRMATSNRDSPGETARDVDFCVDPTSAVLRSGVHYGDKSETLQEWRAPVTIIGSHNCELKFFEPMVSWKWISNNVYNSVWPKHRTSNIQYRDKSAFPAIPTTWEVEVSQGCAATHLSAFPSGTCTVRIVIEGDACQAGSSCSPVGVTKCGVMPDCLTGAPYVLTTTTTTTFTIGSVDDMVADWKVDVLDSGSSQKYKIAFEWEHRHDRAVRIGTRNPMDDPRCSGSSDALSPIDNVPYWMPRFISRPVPPEVTALTGIRFASIDWQPCGHKDRWQSDFCVTDASAG
jgi:hypothetical protein